MQVEQWKANHSLAEERRRLSEYMLELSKMNGETADFHEKVKSLLERYVALSCCLFSLLLLSVCMSFVCGCIDLVLTRVYALCSEMEVMHKPYQETIGRLKVLQSLPLFFFFCCCCCCFARSLN